MAADEPQPISSREAFLAMDQPTVARWASYYLGVSSRVRDARDANYLRSLVCPFIGIRVGGSDRGVGMGLC